MQEGLGQWPGAGEGAAPAGPSVSLLRAKPRRGARRASGTSPEGVRHTGGSKGFAGPGGAQRRKERKPHLQITPVGLFTAK